MTWRAMNSLLVLREQVNQIAPNRSKLSDGLVGDAAHQAEQSDHNPHPVAGVGDEMVTALDLTHDPANGFDSYLFAEVLRIHRDPRIKYVISNHRSFNSSTWTWHDYTGSDPHTNHVHISVLDAPISDTRTLWNLEGFVADYTEAQMKAFPWQYTGKGIGENNGTTVQRSTLSYFDEVLDNSRRIDTVVTQINELSTAFAEVKAALDQILAKLDAIDAKVGSNVITPFPLTTSTYTASSTGTVTWNPLGQ